MGENLESIFKLIDAFIKIDPGENLDEILLNKCIVLNESELNWLSTIQCTPNSDDHPRWKYVCRLLEVLLRLAKLIENDNNLLLSVKHQKTTKMCLQFIVSFGLLPSLIPGIGLPLNKRSEYAKLLKSPQIDDLKKYEQLKVCTNFFTQLYEIPILKSLITTNHFSDFIAALLQIIFAPLKKPGIYANFSMSEELYERLKQDKAIYLKIYDYIMSNSFQPIVMRELLVLQSVDNPPPPNFIKKVIAKELSKRLLCPGGVLSLIRCLMDTAAIDSGSQWKQIDLISRIISTKHGDLIESEYLKNICKQLKDIMSGNNLYISVAAACLRNLLDEYPENESVLYLTEYLIEGFRIEFYENKHLPGTLIQTTSDIDQKIAVLQLCFCTSQLGLPSHLLKQAIYIIFLLRLNCKKTKLLQINLDAIIMKYISEVNHEEIKSLFKLLIYGTLKDGGLINLKLLVEETASGVRIKSVIEAVKHPSKLAAENILDIFTAHQNAKVMTELFGFCLEMLCSLTKQRKLKSNKELLLLEDTDTELMETIDEHYMITLKMLEVLSSNTIIITSLKDNNDSIIKFIEYFIVDEDNSASTNSNDECLTIALVLLNTILSESKDIKTIQSSYGKLKSELRKLSLKDGDPHIKLLAEEALYIMETANKPKKNKPESKLDKIITSICDPSIPMRAHGLMELGKLIECGDDEALSKKHYIFCLYQEHLKDEDSYIYLTAINGIAKLANVFAEDVLQVLCAEFLRDAHEDNSTNAKNHNSETRMKIGDVLVKVTKNLGDIAPVHKTILLNTFLCGCRDYDDLIRTSSLSNLAEVAKVLSYKLGTIVHEILMCIWSIVETDKSPQCRRAAVMVVAELLEGFGRDNLIDLKDVILPIYRSLKKIYRDNNEDEVVRLHAQLGLEHLNDAAKDFLFPDLKLEKNIFVIDKPDDIY